MPPESMNVLRGLWLSVKCNDIYVQDIKHNAIVSISIAKRNIS